MTLDETFQTAARHHATGQLAQAEALYREILAQAPNHAETFHRLGVLFFQTSRPDEASRFLARAIQLDPNQANYYSNLGVVLADRKQYPQAAEVLHKALSLRPDLPDTHNNLANVLNELGRTHEAVSSYQRAISLRPDYVEAHYNLGNVLLKLGQTKDSIAAQQRAISFRPAYAEAHCSLAAALRDDGQIEQAIAQYRKAIELRPDMGEAHNGLGAILQETGELEEALAFYRRAATLTTDPRVIDNLLVLLHLDPANDAQAIFEHHAGWNRDYARAFAPRTPSFGDPDAQRRLRIGYVSANFNNHPVGRFLTPLLTNHDGNRFEIFCYSDTQQADATTNRLRSSCDHWHDTRLLSDEQLAQLIARNRIDILVDLGMHTKGNRIFVFARKPAPVQATYLAFCSTTALQTIHYRLSDPFLARAARVGVAPAAPLFPKPPPPAGLARRPPDLSLRLGWQQPFYSERTVRLRSYWCYPPPQEAGEPGPLPATQAGHITFGCLNNFSKISRPALEMWLEILRSAPNSRLMLNAPEGNHRQRARARATDAGIDAERLEFVPHVPMPEYFRRYQQIDIALDPTPYCGGTTTCDALWMGVPLVTLPGQTAVSRGGASILSTLGLPELIAQSRDDYIRIAADLAHDLPRLSSLRATLRPSMQSSPLMDAPAFARDVEAAYRRMRQTWCEGQHG